MLKILSTLFLLVASASASMACYCGITNTVSSFQSASFVARVKILTISPDPKNEDRHDAEIEVITLYKGTATSKIKIISDLRSSCAFLPKPNSIWMVYASVWSGVLSFDYCSGSEIIGRTVTENGVTKTHYPWYVEREESVLTYLRDKKLLNPNPMHLWALPGIDSTLKGYKNRNTFAVFQIQFREDRSIVSINPIKKFTNPRLTRAVIKSMYKNLKLFNAPGRKSNQASQMLMVWYYYEAKDGKQSSVSWL